METLRGILIKTFSEPMQRIYTRGSLLERSLINLIHCLFTTPLIVLPCFPLLKCKIILQVEFLNDSLVHMQPEVLNNRTFKMFQAKF